MASSGLFIAFYKNRILCIQKQHFILDILTFLKFPAYPALYPDFHRSAHQFRSPQFFICVSKICCKIHKFIQKRNRKIIDTKESHIFHHFHCCTFFRLLTCPSQLQISSRTLLSFSLPVQVSHQTDFFTRSCTSFISCKISAAVAFPLFITNPQCFSETWACPTA